MNVSEAFKSRNMKSMFGDHVLRNWLSRLTFEYTPKIAIKSLSETLGESSILGKGRAESVIRTMNKLGVKILQVGGVEKVFRRIFSVREGEKLLKASQCYLSTSEGPIPGRLFILIEKLAFSSDRAIAKYASLSRELLRFLYKVVILLRKIKRGNQSENVKKKKSQKNLKITTTDDFEFWF